MALVETASELIRKFEGYISKPMWDVNAYRLGYGSDTIELPNGTHRKVLKTDVTTREYAEKDLKRRLTTEFIPRAKSQVGEPYWSNLPIPAQASLVSLAYNYGSIPKKEIIKAARSGDVNSLAKAIVDSTYNDNKGILRGRRKQEADFAKSMITKIKDSATKIEQKAEEHPAITVVGIIIIGIALAVLYKAIKSKK